MEHYRSLFQRFAALSTPPIEVIGIPYQDTRLPAYFLRPDAGGEPHPTVIIGDNTSEELYYWVGPPGVERGYNVLLVDLPGMGLNTFHGVYFRPDTEVAIGACIDYLSERSRRGSLPHRLLRRGRARRMGSGPGRGPRTPDRRLRRRPLRGRQRRDPVGVPPA